MKNVLRNIFGCLFIFIGFFGMLINGFFAGIFLILFGISLFPALYRNTKIDIKYIQIILPIVFLGVFSVIVADTANTTEKLHFDKSVILLDVGETKEVVLEINSKKIKVDDLEYFTSDNQVATIQKVNETADNIILKIQSVTEGSCEVYVRSLNGEESNRVFVNIVDHERIEQEKKEKEEAEIAAQKEAEEQAKKEAEIMAQKEAEEQAKKEAEIAARKEAEEQAKKEAEIAAQKEAEEQAKKEAEIAAQREAEEQAKKEAETEAQNSTISQADKTVTQNNKSDSKNNSNNTHGEKVFRTPSGKRYHFDPDCGGKNSYEITMESAISSGLTPCKKCAQ